jgi:hypothetical protein
MLQLLLHWPQALFLWALLRPLESLPSESEGSLSSNNGAASLKPSAPKLESAL